MFGSRLRLARKKAGYSLRSLADALDVKVTPQAIGKYERGQIMPSSKVIVALSEVLNVQIDYLLNAQGIELTEVEFRKKSNTTAKIHAEVEVNVLEHVERYLQIENILEIDSTEWKSPFSHRKFVASIEDAEELAIEVRNVWNLGIAPIPDMTELLEEKGLKVLILDLPMQVSGLTCTVKSPSYVDGIPVIVINKNFTLERRRLTLAHELAHRLIEPESLSDKDEEKFSNRFGGAFIIPKNHVRKEVGSVRHSLGYQEVIFLKKIYRISGAAFLVRLRDLGIISDSYLRYSFQSIARGWRTKEPSPLEAMNQEGSLEPAKRFERLCYRALAEELISINKASELLQIPIPVVQERLHGPKD